MNILTPSALGLDPDLFPSFRPGQDTLASQLSLSPHRFTELNSPCGCIAGDSVIQVARGAVLRVSNKRKIADEFRKQNSWRRDHTIQTYTRSLLDHGSIASQAVSHISYSGERATCELSLHDGKSLRATPDHQIMTPEGWRALGDLAPGKAVVVDTGEITRPNTYRPKLVYQYVQGLLHHPHASTYSYTRRGTIETPKRVLLHRLVIEAELNGLPLGEFIAICRNSPKEAVKLKFLSPDLIVHHLDENTKNNDRANLEVLTRQEHPSRHDPTQHIRSFPVEVRVKSLRRHKVEPTFDLTCDGPCPNFVANGIVVHNSGKSVTLYSTALLSDSRLLIVTPQKAHQDQLMSDFGPPHGDLADVRGQSNYPCPTFRNCEIGAANECPLRRLPASDIRRCPNTKAIDHARQSKHVVTNNAFWMTQGKASQSPSESGAPPSGIGHFDLVVIDEGHGAHDKLAEFCAITIFEEEIEKLLSTRTPSTSSLHTWSSWARETYPKLPPIIKLAGTPRDRWRLKSIERDLVELSSVSSDTQTEWIYQHDSHDHKHTFTPVWAGTFAESYLFQRAPRVIIASGTLLEGTGRYLGIPTDQSEYVDVANTFPPSSRPFIYTPSGIRLNWKSAPSDIRVLMSTYDKIIDLWAGQAGHNMLFHTQSHLLTEKLLDATRNRKRILVYDKGGVTEAIRKLIDNPDSGLVVMGPGMKEGLSLDYAAARAQIIAKMPINNVADPVTKARAESDPHYLMDQTVIQTMQTTARIVRAADDWGYTFTGDGMWTWVNKEGRLPESFRSTIRWENGGVPGPPKR